LTPGIGQRGRIQQKKGRKYKERKEEGGRKGPTWKL
jgi:hypothetical protein